MCTQLYTSASEQPLNEERTFQSCCCVLLFVHYVIILPTGRLQLLSHVLFLYFNNFLSANAQCNSVEPQWCDSHMWLSSTPPPVVLVGLCRCPSVCRCGSKSPWKSLFEGRSRESLMALLHRLKVVFEKLPFGGFMSKRGHTFIHLFGLWVPGLCVFASPLFWLCFYFQSYQCLFHPHPPPCDGDERCFVPLSVCICYLGVRWHRGAARLLPNCRSGQVLWW